MGQGGEEDHGEGTKVYGEVIKLRSLTDDQIRKVRKLHKNVCNTRLLDLKKKDPQIESFQSLEPLLNTLLKNPACLLSCPFRQFPVKVPAL